MSLFSPNGMHDIDLGLERKKVQTQKVKIDLTGDMRPATGHASYNDLVRIVSDPVHSPGFRDFCWSKDDEGTPAFFASSEYKYTSENIYLSNNA